MKPLKSTQTAKAYAAFSAQTPLKPYTLERRFPKTHEILIQILYCGICHSDIHTARSEWGPTTYPCVPGHEIIGRVIKAGKGVKKFKQGDIAGVGCFIDSCGSCSFCKSSEQQHCKDRTVFTYDDVEFDQKTRTFGGYSTHLTVQESFAYKIKKNAPLAKIAPLLCAGITTYSPLKYFKVKKGMKVAIIGLGGLGHIAIKIAKAMGAEVSVYSTSLYKKPDAKKLGAKHFIYSKEPSSSLSKWNQYFDLILDTVSAPHDLSLYLEHLKPKSTLALVGGAPQALQFLPFSLITGQKSIMGSFIGGTKETQEMLDFCIRKKVYADIELIEPHQINEAYDRIIKNQVKYRFVLDTSKF